MTDLAQQLRERIREHGPLRLDIFMELANAHYYANAQPIGADGDFTTAPEISQIFGEIVGAWLAQSWQSAGKPQRFTLLELGPGRGTLMRDALRIAETIEGFREAIELVVLELNPLFREAAVSRGAHVLSSADELANLPHQPLLGVANEFLDALPLRQFHRQAGMWMERHLTANQTPSPNDDFTFAPLPAHDLPPPDLHPAAPPRAGDIMEHCAPAHQLITNLAHHIRTHTGAFLVMDYGPSKSGYGDSLQAVRAHMPTAVLDNIGESDLSAHVDFAALAATARANRISVTPVRSQAQFLRACGAELRAAKLMEIHPANAEEIRQGIARLLHPQAMGEIFKAMALHSNTVAVEGFAP